MAQRGDCWATLLKFAAYGVALSCFVTYLPAVAELLILDAKIVRISETEWDIYPDPSLSDGQYFISLGRPKGSCSIVYEGNQIASNHFRTETIRDSLLVGATFDWHKKPGKALHVACLSNEGFRPQLAGNPAIARPSVGKLLHLSRAFSQVILGPTVAFILMLVAMLYTLWVLTRQSILGAEQSLTSAFALILFSSVALLYSFSLSHYPRLFLSSSSATNIHIIIRSLFTITFLFFASLRRKTGKIYLMASIIPFLGVLVALTVEQRWLIDVYKAELFVFMLVTASFGVSIAKRPEARWIDIFLGAISIGWTGLQAVDYASSFLFQFGDNLSFAIVILMLLGITFLIYADLKSIRVLNEIRSVALSLSGPETNPMNALSLIVTAIREVTGFERSSLFLDSWTLAEAAVPGVEVKCIMSTVADVTGLTISLQGEPEGHSQWVRAAFRCNKILSGYSVKSRKPFMIIPLGEVGCISFTDLRSKHNQAIEYAEFLAIAQKLPEILRPFTKRIAERAATHTRTYGRVKSDFGIGTHQRRMGSLFLDISDYSKHMELYGSAYSRFIETVFFPKIESLVSALAFIETSKGDELHFTFVDKTGQSASTVDQAVYDTLTSLVEFMSNGADKICANAGLPLQHLTIGAALGYGEIIVDERQVRTSGNLVNYAKRLQQIARKNQVLLHSLGPVIEKTGYSISENRTVLVKKNTIDVVELLYNSSALFGYLVGEG